MINAPGARVAALLALATAQSAFAAPPQQPPYAVNDGAYEVMAGQEIQGALDLAAADPLIDTVRVFAGTYRPSQFGQALIWFNASHDGIRLEAVGHVVLTAANPDLAPTSVQQAVVNHVVYFGDGISNETVLRGFEITGADNYVTTKDLDVIEPNHNIPKPLFFFTDGGGIKVFGRSYPTIERVFVHSNYASPCGGGISIQHFDENARAPVTDQWVIIRDSVFKENVAQTTGSAVDLLPGSRAKIINSLFVGNMANTGMDLVSWYKGLPPYNGENGSGALTIFEGSRVVVSNSTFTGNWNGVDDRSTGSIYENSIFWRNDIEGGISRGPRYELDLTDGAGVRGNFINGEVGDLRGNVSRVENEFTTRDPLFDDNYVPRDPAYAQVGYRPPDTHGETTAERR